MIQVYTGNGKGKTTAALGLCLRAAGAGMKSCVIQFLKKGDFSEIRALKKIEGVKVHQCGSKCFLRKAPEKKDISSAKKGLAKAKQAIKSAKYPLVVLDEINVALSLGLLEIKEVAEMLKKSPEGIEIVLTGRGLHPKIKKLAHLVSEVKEVKHYFKKGKRARKGFEY